MICYQYLGYINVLGGFFLSVTNKMVESLLQCQTFSQMFFHIIEKVRILNIYIYIYETVSQTKGSVIYERNEYIQWAKI